MIQRLTSIGYASVPVIVISALIQASDKPLLREMGVANALHKPFDSESFFATVIWTMQQKRNPTERRMLELKIRNHLEKGEVDAAEEVLLTYKEIKSIPEGDLALIYSEIAFSKENYQLGFKICKE